MNVKGLNEVDRNEWRRIILCARSGIMLFWFIPQVLGIKGLLVIVVVGGN